MSKPKDIEKIKAEKEHVEKIKPEKEHIKIEKIEKHEHKEFKEPYKEKIEHKEKPEKQEIKEKPEKLEHKDKIEIKEHAKPEFEKPGADTFDPGDIVTRQASFQAPSQAADAGSIAKPKELEKATKDIEKIKPEKELKLEKYEAKEHKREKLEIKEKPEKFEKHEKYEKEHHKPEKHEKEGLKLEIKEFKLEQNEQLKDFTTEGPVGKEQVEGPIDFGGEVVNPFKATGTAEERLADLEDALSRLSHFIGVNLRPDLSAGALNREPDVAKETPAPPAKPDDKTKKS